MWNNCLDGYITEKLVDCLTCNSVPIYFGPLHVEKYFPELFDRGVINGYNYTTDELIDKLQRMTDDEYNERVTKINSQAEKLIDAFTECSELSIILKTFFSKFGISIQISEGSEFLVQMQSKCHWSLW